MPVVPSYGGRKVQQQQAPGVRLSANAPARAFIPAQPVDIGKVLPIIERINEQADQVAVQRASTELAATETELLYGQNGVLTRQGENAFTAPEEVTEAWAKRTSEIASRLKTPRQRQAFEQDQAARWNSVNSAVTRHVANEAEKYDTAQTSAFTAEERRLAILNYTDPERVQVSIQRQVKALGDWHKRIGSPPEVLEQAVSDALTKTHVGVINRLLTADQDLAAAKYFADNKDQMSGDAVAQVEANVQEGSSRGESQRRADAIMRQYGTESDAIDAVKAIEEPKLRDAVQQRVEHEWGRKRAREREEENDLYIEAGNAIDARRGVSARVAVPPHIWNKLKPTQKRSLEIYAEGGSGGSSGGGSGGGASSSTSDAAFLSLIEMDADELKELNRSEFETRYLSKLKPRERGRAITMWKNAKEGKGEGSSGGTTTTLSFKERVQSTLYRSRLLRSDSETSSLSRQEKSLLVTMEAEADEGVRAFRGTKGRNPDADETQKIVDGVVLRKAFAPGETQKIDIREKGKVVGTVIKNKDGSIRFPYGDIPADAMTEFRRLAAERGVTLTRKMAEEAYATRLTFGIAAGRTVISRNR